MSVFTGLTDFDPVPSLQTPASVTVSTKVDADAAVVGYLVSMDSGACRTRVRRGLARGCGVRGKDRPDHRPPVADGPMTVLVGVGELADLDADRAQGCRRRLRPGYTKHGNLTLTLGETAPLPPTLPAKRWWKGHCWPAIDTTS